MRLPGLCKALFCPHCSQPKYYNVLGLWAMEQGAPEKAILYFDEAIRKNFKDASFNRALALTEAHDFSHALPAWDSLGQSADTQIKKEAAKKTAVITISPEKALALSDEEKYEFSHYRFSLLQDQDFAKFINSIYDPTLKARAIVDHCSCLARQRKLR